MKYPNPISFVAIVALLSGSVFSASGQLKPLPPRNTNQSHLTLERLWTANFTDPVKLIEIGPALDDKRNSLVLLVGGKEKTDYRRKLVVMHWEGLRFVEDSSNDFMGTTTDALLLGRFRSVAAAGIIPAQAPVVKTGKPPVKGAKKAGTRPTRQIITTEGIYMWTGGTLGRLFSAPPNLRLGLMLDGSPDQMVINSGDSATPYEAGETDVHPSAFLMTKDVVGYVRFAVGTQPYEGSKDFLAGVRIVQTYWSGRTKWLIGLLRGQPANTTDFPDATTGDRLVIYVPKQANRDKSNWEMIRTDDYDEAWRSDPLPGRVLDVRVGDPKNDGKEGILVLTAENNETERHLYFYAPANGFQTLR